MVRGQPRAGAGVPGPFSHLTTSKICIRKKLIKNSIRNDWCRCLISGSCWLVRLSFGRNSPPRRTNINTVKVSTLIRWVGEYRTACRSEPGSQQGGKNRDTPFLLRGFRSASSWPMSPRLASVSSGNPLQESITRPHTLTALDNPLVAVSCRLCGVPSAFNSVTSQGQSYFRVPRRIW